MRGKSALQLHAYEYLKEQILSGKLSPDEIYSETKLSAEIGISRTPMREAIQCLSQDGYLTVVPSKGFMIRQLNEHDMEETIQVRCAIEGFCVHLIAQEIDTKKGQNLLSELGKIVDKQEKVLAMKNEQTAMKRFMEYDHQFHMALIDFVGNKEFQQLFQRLMYLIHLTTVEALAVPGRIEGTLQEHRDIYHQLRDGNGDDAYRTLISHLNAPLSIYASNNVEE